MRGLFSQGSGASASPAARCGAETGAPGVTCASVILGSTGSIGEQTLEVVEAFPERYPGRSARRRAQRGPKLADQVRRFRPERVSVADATAAAGLRQRRLERRATRRPSGRRRGAGGRAATRRRPGRGGPRRRRRPGAHPGRGPRGSGCGLANKEVLVMAGALVNRARWSTPASSSCPWTASTAPSSRPSPASAARTWAAGDPHGFGRTLPDLERSASPLPRSRRRWRIPTGTWARRSASIRPRS